MTMMKLNQMIDGAITDCKIRNRMETTNILNAEFALGKVFALIDVVEELYGIEALIPIKCRMI